MTKEELLKLMIDHKTKYVYIAPLSKMVHVRNLGEEYVEAVDQNGKFSMKMKYDYLRDVVKREVAYDHSKVFYKMKHKRYLECYLS